MIVKKLEIKQRNISNFQILKIKNKWAFPPSSNKTTDDDFTIKIYTVSVGLKLVTYAVNFAAGSSSHELGKIPKRLT